MQNTMVEGWGMANAEQSEGAVRNEKERREEMKKMQGKNCIKNGAKCLNRILFGYKC